MSLISAFIDEFEKLAGIPAAYKTKGKYDPAKTAVITNPVMREKVNNHIIGQRLSGVHNEARAAQARGRRAMAWARSDAESSDIAARVGVPRSIRQYQSARDKIRAGLGSVKTDVREAYKTAPSAMGQQALAAKLKERKAVAAAAAARMPVPVPAAPASAPASVPASALKAPMAPWKKNSLIAGGVAGSGALAYYLYKKLRKPKASEILAEQGRGIA